MPDRERREFQITGPMYLKHFFSRVLCLSQEHGRSEYPKLSEESEKESRDEATHRGMEKLYQRQCGSR